VEDPRKHVELLELMELAEPRPTLGARPDAGMVPAEESVAAGPGINATDPGHIAPDGPCAEAARIVERSADAGDEHCDAVVHKGSDTSDEDHSTVAPSDFEVSSDEDQSIVDVDEASACELHGAALCGVGRDLDVGTQDHKMVDSRDVDVCCEYRGNTVSHGERRDRHQVHDIVGFGTEPSGTRQTSDFGWEDRGAEAASKMLRRVLSRAAPAAEVLPLPVLSGSRRRRVRFDMGAITLHKIPPYGEIYGAHPRTFVFDRHSRRVPAASNGYVSLHAVTGEDDEESSDASSEEEDEEFGIVGKGARSDNQESEAEAGVEEDSWESYLDETSDDHSSTSPAEHFCIPSDFGLL